MAGIFDVGVGEVMGSNVSPSQPVTEVPAAAYALNTAASIFSEAAPIYKKQQAAAAVDTEQRALSGFAEKMAALADDVTINGTSPDRASIRARQEWVKAKKLYPGMSEKIDKTFNNFFSGPLGNVIKEGNEQYQADNQLISQARSWIRPGMTRDQQLQVATLWRDNQLWRAQIDNNLKAAQMEKEQLESQKFNIQSSKELVNLERAKIGLSKARREEQAFQSLLNFDSAEFSNGYSQRVSGLISSARVATTAEEKASIAQGVDIELAQIEGAASQYGAYLGKETVDPLMRKYRELADYAKKTLSGEWTSAQYEREVKNLDAKNTYTAMQKPEVQSSRTLQLLFPRADITQFAVNKNALEFAVGLTGGDKGGYPNVLGEDGNKDLPTVYNGIIKPNIQALKMGAVDPKIKEEVKKTVDDTIVGMLSSVNAYADANGEGRKASDYNAVVDVLTKPEMMEYFKTVGIPKGVGSKLAQIMQVEYSQKVYKTVAKELDGFKFNVLGPKPVTWGIRELVEPKLIGGQVVFVPKAGKSISPDDLRSLNLNVGKLVNRTLSLNTVLSGQSPEEIFNTTIAPQIGYPQEQEQPK